jgi:hypothetical protein
VKARKVKGLDPAGPLAGNAARIVSVRLDELLSMGEAALEARNVDALHDTRIAAKRLRYVLEVTEFCFGAPAAKARRSARDLQDLLGEIHDCDVMLPRVVDHQAELSSKDVEKVLRRAGDAADLDPRLASRAPNRTAYRGLDVLAVYLRARRQLLFERFRRLWPELERQGVWLRLEETLGRPRVGTG